MNKYEKIYNFCFCALFSKKRRKQAITPQSHAGVSYRNHAGKITIPIRIAGYFATVLIRIAGCNAQPPRNLLQIVSESYQNRIKSRFQPLFPNMHKGIGLRKKRFIPDCGVFDYGLAYDCGIFWQFRVILRKCGLTRAGMNIA